MLSLDQIKQLESRVSKAIELMQSLKDENDLLKLELHDLKLELHDRQKRIDELENILLVFKNDQAKIEEGIISALNHLSAFEDTVYQSEGVSVSTLAENHTVDVSSTSTQTNTSGDSENTNTNQMEIF